MNYLLVELDQVKFERKKNWLLVETHTLRNTMNNKGSGFKT